MKKICFWLLGIVLLCACQTQSYHSLYHKAIMKAMHPSGNEIHALVCLTEDSPDVEFKNGKVLLLTWHKHPHIYQEGTSFISEPKAIWTVSAKEFENRLQKERKNTDMRLRTCQLMGLPDTIDYTHFSYIWVEPKALLRPAYQTDVTLNEMTFSFKESTDETYRSWFAEQMREAYPHQYPWTRLGYTYDWADNGTCYGLTEFIIPKGTSVEVKQTLSNKEFLKMME